MDKALNNVEKHLFVPEFKLTQEADINYDRVPKVESSQDCVRFLNEYIRQKGLADQINVNEFAFVVFLNRRNKILGITNHSKGGIDSTLMDMRLMLGQGLIMGAAAFIVAHNHPTGNLQPSEADRRMSSQLSKAGKMINLQMLDFIILTSTDGYYSFADNGMMDEFEGGGVVKKLVKGGPIESLKKELLKLQRDLNSTRLRVYTEGNDSPEERARQLERKIKLARFQEVLQLLNESGQKFDRGGQVGSKLMAPKGYVFTTFGSHRASDRVRSLGVKYVSIYSFTVGSGTAGSSTVMLKEADYEKINHVKGVGKPRTSLPANHVWFSRAENAAYKRLFDKTRDAAEGTEIKADFSNFYRKGGVVNMPPVDKNNVRKIDDKSIQQLTDYVNSLPQTKSLHFDEDAGKYTPERRRLHAEIINKFKREVVCITEGTPIAILMGGSPASGKSSFLKKYSDYLLQEEILRIDADEIRAQLPEYKGYNATQTQAETKDIVNTLLSDKVIGIPCDFDMIYDGTMNNVKSYIPLIEMLKKRGYLVFIAYIDKVPKDVIVDRILKRYQKTGRFVPLEVVDDFFQKGRSAFEQLKDMVDGYMVVDGSNQEYAVIERGGMELPKERAYSMLGYPIPEKMLPKEYAKGGNTNKNQTQISFNS